MSTYGRTRRQALTAFGSFLAASPLVRAQKLIGEPSGRIAPVGELVNTFEFEQMAQRKLDAPVFAAISGSDRTDIDRITFRPHYMVDTTKLDLATPLFGENMFAPILVGPVAMQQRYHADGELATVRGASGAKAVVVLSSLSSHPLDKIMAEAKTPVWYQVFPGPDVNAMRAKAQEAVKLGCKVLVVTVRTPYESSAPAQADAAKPAPRAAAINWARVDQLRQGLSVPVVIKGIMTAEEADAAIKHGAQGIVVSNYGGRFVSGGSSSFMAIQAVVDAVAGKVPVLADGNLRRGTDIMKALIMGAQAVLLGRPPMWGLAAYGDIGVQTVVEMLQTELGRNMTMIGAVNAKAFTRTMIKVHAPIAAK